MSGGYNAVVMRPDTYKIQTESNAQQKPFFFGAAQTPTALFLSPKTFSGSGMTVLHTDPVVSKKPFHLPFSK